MYTSVPAATLRQTLALTTGDRDAFLKLGSQLSAADRQAALAAGMNALASCWGERSQNCARGNWDGLTWPTDRCKAFGYGYVGDFDKFQAAINALPYCDETTPWKYAALAAVGGTLFGIGLGVLFASK